MRSPIDAYFAALFLSAAVFHTPDYFAAAYAPSPAAAC